MRDQGQIRSRRRSQGIRLAAAGALLLAGLGVPTAAGAQTPPANDNFSSATVLSGGTQTGDTTGATAEAGEPSHGGPSPATASVWFRWRETSRFNLAVDTEGSAFDTVLSAYRGASLAELTRVTGNDDADPSARHSRILFTAEADTDYYIALDGFQGSRGMYTLNVGTTLPPQPRDPDERPDPSTIRDGSGPTGTDISDRTTSTELWRTQYAPGIDFDPGWTGDTETCNAGTTSAEFKQQVQNRINHMRALAGVNDIVLDPNLNAGAQQAALMMAANGDLDHEPPPTWRCWTQEGADSAGRSNLAFGSIGTESVDRYMADFSTPSLGHRVAVLSPWILSMGTGDTDRTNALHAFGRRSDHGSTPQVRQPFVAWPPPGHVPFRLLFPSWSLFTAPDEPAIEEVLWVTMTRGPDSIPTGETRLLDGGRGFAWEPEIPIEVQLDPDGDVAFVTTVAFRAGGIEHEHSWRTTFIDPTEPARWAAGDRYATAGVVAMHNWQDGADTVYVATGENFPDGLAAGQNDAPVVLTGAASLHEAARTAIQYLGPDRIIVLGGTSAVSDAVLAELQALAPTTRHSGSDRFETAAAHSLAQWPSGANTVYVATGANYPDALAAGAADQPILLTRTDSLPATTREALEQLSPERITVLGGPSAVSEAVVAELGAIAPTARVSGANRFETAANLARALFDAGTEKVYIATAGGFADALAAGGGSHAILLVRPDGVPAETAAALTELQPDNIVILGGQAAVNHQTAAHLLTLER